MLDIAITFLTFVLILLSFFMVLVILMQRASANAGMGSAFGGGAAESAFGAETTNILTRATKWSAFGFFAISLSLYLMYMYKTRPAAEAEGDLLPQIAVETTAAPTTMTETLDAAAEEAVGAVDAAAEDVAGAVDAAEGEATPEVPVADPQP